MEGNLNINVVIAQQVPKENIFLHWVLQKVRRDTTQNTYTLNYRKAIRMV